MRKRPLGQNFLVDPEITQKIIDLANIQPEDNVVEIGPGKGVLTQRLISIISSLTVIEPVSYTHLTLPTTPYV